MASFDPEKWAKSLAANPPPSYGRDPATWPTGMPLDNEDSWRAYGHTVLVFAERWADEMERLMRENDASVATVAEAAEHTANEGLGQWGVTGFQYGCAVSTLVHCWAHGEELRRWHNLKTQIGNEGERANEKPGAVLNPALLRLG